MELSELHSCPQSEGKMVYIEIDQVGIERCGYCGAIVRYSEWFKKQYPEMWKKANERSP